MLNDVTLMGRLTRDPEVRHTQNNTTVATFTIAADRDFGNKTADFFDVVAWRSTAEFVSKYFKKGQLIAVNGHLQTRTWTDKHEQKRKETEVIAESVYFCESKKHADDSSEDAVKEPQFTELSSEDGELPF